MNVNQGKRKKQINVTISIIIALTVSVLLNIFIFNKINCSQNEIGRIIKSVFSYIIFIFLTYGVYKIICKK